ncbi:MAG TPA: class I SAM-dependent methyltransferase [bacterium]|nr:class I SAM-dependent methyltransferase [bacterium]
MKRYLETNRAMWDVWTKYHVASSFYDVEGFKAGTSRRRAGLDELEMRLLGNVTGKTLLHLQCHFGLDTIAWARRGAVATGVDFSGEAIAAARALAAEVGVPATFVESDLYALSERLRGEFDLVFTSHGVLCWLPDLDRWARVIAHFLRPGGTFCIIEGHPFAMIFDEAREDRELRPRYPYFYSAEPERSARRGSYAAPDAPTDSLTYQWMHPLADVVGALVRAGLRIETFEEYPYVGWAMFPWMEERPDGTWQLPSGTRSIPLMFSLTASTDAR